MNYPKVTENISHDMYAEDLTSAGNILEKVGILN